MIGLTSSSRLLALETMSCFRFPRRIAALALAAALLPLLGFAPTLRAAPDATPAKKSPAKAKEKPKKDDAKSSSSPSSSSAAAAKKKPAPGDPATAPSSAKVEDLPPATIAAPGVPAASDPTGRIAPYPTAPGTPGTPVEPPVAGAGIVHRRELRGVWVASVSNINWPPRAGMGAGEAKAALVRLLDTIRERRLNAIFFQVRPECDALYRSRLEPWSRFLTGTQGQDPGYDPLQFLIDEARKRNIEVHAWFNPYRAASNAGKPLAANHPARTLSQYVRSVPPYLWMDPGAPAVQDHTFNVIMDVVRRYDVDGIHFDDYFYPYPKIPGVPIDFPDGETYRAYRSGGGTLDLGDWRRNNVSTLMARISRAIKAEKPWVRFGISPFGISRPGIPAGTEAKLNQYTMIYADPVKWMREGYVDYLAPQLYWRDGGPQSFSLLLRYWRGAEANPRGVPIYPGLAVDRMTEQGWPLSEIKAQLDLTRSITMRGANEGHILWNAKTVVGNTKDVGNALSNFYGPPALSPRIGGTAGSAKAPEGVAWRDGKLTWTGTGARAYVIYRRDPAAGWIVYDIVPGNTRQVQAPNAVYAITAADRNNRESAPVIAR
ncbi:hypothetical protein DB346_09935 [Verrucomicrobia bacterium LW23]|nr:hypothetical protein DB346_09935 [Verrucomicrobia bacterium LW23]